MIVDYLLFLSVAFIFPIKYSVNNWSKEKNFEYGYPPTGDTYFGLWNPVLNCFLFVHWDLNLLKRIQWILSSKLLIVIIQFQDHVAKANLIDNSCCHNWTVDSVNKQIFATAYKDANDIKAYPIKKADQNIVTEDRDYITKFCFFCTYWYKEIENKFYQSHLERMTDLVTDGELHQLEQWVYQTLWLSKDIDKIDKEINARFNRFKSRTD